MEKVGMTVTRAKIFYLCYVMLAFGASGRAFGDMKATVVDPHELRARETYALPLRWENVEGSPYWVAGAKPHYRQKEQMHLVSLEPGEDVVIKLPPRERLRVLNAQQPFQADDLEFWLSDGSGAYVNLPPQRSADAWSLLFSSDRSSTMLVRIRRPPQHQRALMVALFLSRSEPLDTIVPYRTMIKLAGTPVFIRRTTEATGVPFWLLTPETPQTITLRGPARLAMDTRLLYAPTETQPTQTYRIAVQMDAQTTRVLEFTATSERFSRVLVNGQEHLTAQHAVGYLEIPSGEHRLVVRPLASAYLRLLQMDDNDYLLPAFNRPSSDTHQSSREETALPSSALGCPRLDRQTPQSTVLTPATLADTAQQARCLARDNRYRDSGIAGAALLNTVAATRPDYPLLQQLAEDTRRFHTFYRDVLPVEKHGNQPQQLGWFLPRQLQSPFTHEQSTAIAQQHVNELRSRLPNALFVPLPATAANAHVYKLPARSGPSRLRLVVENGALPGAHEFFIQYDRHPAIRAFVGPGLALPVSHYLPSDTEAALRAFARQQQETATPRADAYQLWSPHPLLQVGTVELPLPSEVTEVRLWKTAENSAPIQVALQYSAGKPYRLSEMEYLGLVQHLGVEEMKNSFLAVLTDENFPEDTAQSLTLELANHWLPLVRFLRTQQKIFTAAVAPVRSSLASSSEPLDDQKQVALLTQAQQLEQSGQWVAAVEAWAQLVYAGTGDRRRQALFGRVHALLAMGETFLAEQQLRGMMLYDQDKVVQAQAQDRLIQFYTEATDPEALLALAAARTLRTPISATFQLLLETLITNGEYEMGLLVGLVMPETKQRLPLVLRAAYQLQWWQTFDRFMAEVTETEQRAYWQGYRAWAQGDSHRALAFFHRAGALGTTLADYLTTGRAIANDLSAADPTTRAQAIFAWERWSARHPGPQQWRVDEAAITDYLGTARVYSIDRDLYAQFYSGTRERPVQLQVLGPLHLKLETRPLHPQEATTPLDDWLYIRGAGQLRAVPITNNLPSSGLVMVEDPTRKLGRRVSTDIELGPGLHRLSIFATSAPILVRAHVQQPEMALTVLPQFSWQMLNVVWRDAGVSQTTVNNDQGATFSGLDSVLAARLALRLGGPFSPYASILRERVPLEEQLTAEERVLALAVSGKEEQQCENWLREQSPASPQLRNAVCLAEGKLERLLALPAGEGDAATLRRMTLLLMLAEEQPLQRTRAQALGEALFAAHPRTVGLQTLHTRLTRDNTWTPLPAVQSTAGLRSVETQRWQPESPSLRVRRALVPPLQASEYVASGQGHLGISLSNLEPTTLLLNLSSEDVEYLPPVNLAALIQIDHEPARRVLLLEHAPTATLKLPLAAGQHTVRVSIERPVINQFLRIRVREQRMRTDGSAILPTAAVVMTTQRTYHVATHQEPLRFTVKGPTWLRIDELRGHTTISRTQFVDNGWHPLNLKPEPSQPEALFRVFQKLPVKHEGSSAPRLVKSELKPVPPPAPDLRSPSPPRTVAVEDVYPLGRQEDGTWSFTTSFIRRQNFAESDGDDQVPREQFIETLVTHRALHDHLGESYSETQVLSRVREHGGPTLGFAERLRYNLHWDNWMPLILQLHGEGYLQWPGGGRPPSREDLEWSGLFRSEVSQLRRMTPKLEHRPSLSLFARGLSMRRSGQYRHGHVDQDIFTRYKAQHRGGLTLADSLSYSPWLDTEWNTRIALTSNKTIILEQPDYLLLTSSWKQLIRDTQVEPGYSFRSFFADTDRSTTSFRHVVFFSLLQDYWFPWSRLEVGLNLRHDILRTDTAFNISLTWHVDNGRGYRDFRPGTVDFFDIRQRRAAERPSNRVPPLL
jgi:hypothetical protein